MLTNVLITSLLMGGIGSSVPAQASTTETQQQVSATKMGLPLKSKQYRVSSHFGNRCAPVLGAGFFHSGTDMAATNNTPIYSIGDGVVTGYVQGTTTKTGTLSITYNVNGKSVVVGYSHMWEPLKYVKVGNKVVKGQHIADVGSSGVSNGPHLHLSVKVDGKNVDAIPYLKGLGVDLTRNATSVAKVNNPTICAGLYTSAKMGLKKSALNVSDTTTVLNRNHPLAVIPGPAVNGYIKVIDDKTKKSGYLIARNINPKTSVDSPLPPIRNTGKGKRYTTWAANNLRSYPSTDRSASGVLDTPEKGDIFITTGRKVNGYTEVKYGSMTGWIVDEALLYAPDPKTLSNTSKMSSGMVYTPYGSANLFSYPDLSGSVYKESIVKKKSGETFTTTGRAYGDFIEVTYTKAPMNYWVHKSYVKRIPAPLPKLSTTAKGAYYKVKVNSTTLRNYPSSSSVKGWGIKTLKKNYTLTTTGKKYGSYYEVKSGSTTGWVYTPYITRTTAPLPKTSKTAKNVRYRSVTTQNMMTYPSTSTTKGLKVATLKKNYKVVTTGSKYGSWLKVKYGSKSGWVSKYKLKR